MSVSRPEKPLPSAFDRKQRLADARRIVVKIGTNVLCRSNGEIAIGRISSLVEALVDAHRPGRELIIVSSGSIGLGMERLGRKAPLQTLADKQACAAVGQTRLMTLYQQAFDHFGITTAQILLTAEDFSDRTRYLNLRHTFTRLLELRTIPIVNENDTISTSEIETRLDERDLPAVFGDNDVLSALVAAKLDADLLVILSDVDGLHDAAPESNPEARRIPVVPSITPDIEDLARGGSRRGRGGMRTKLRAAKVATHSGVMVVIAGGTRPEALAEILAGNDVGTLFLPGKPLSSRDRWIAFASEVAGRVRVTRDAQEALTHRRASLLFAGVSKLEARFAHGDIVSIIDERGDEFARGVVNYSSDDARRLLGRQSDEITSMHSEEGREQQAPEFIHRDNIVILKDDPGDQDQG